MSYFDGKYRIGYGYSITKAIKYLLIANIALFFLIAILGESFRFGMRGWFGLNLINLYVNYRFWTIVTYMFLHTGFVHLVFNMLVLWMFGCEVERAWGTYDFLKYYIVCGIGGAVFHIIFDIVGIVDPYDIVIGASGAIYGVLVAFAVLFKEQVITLFLFFVFPIRMKAKYLVLVVFGMSLLFFAIWGGNIAHFAHLGGIVFGFFYLRVPIRLPNIPKLYKQTSRRSSMSIISRPNKKIQNAREQVDAILDKINEVGYEKLTEEEKRILTEYSRLLSEKQGE